VPAEVSRVTTVWQIVHVADARVVFKYATTSTSRIHCELVW